MANGEQCSCYHAWGHIICVQMPIFICKQMFPNVFCMLKALRHGQKETGLRELILCNTEKYCNSLKFQDVESGPVLYFFFFFV